MKTKRYYTRSSVYLIGLLLSGCVNLTPTQRLTLAENTYNSAEETLTTLHKNHVIPPQDDKTIVMVVHAARAALDTAYSHQNDSTFATAVGIAESAVASVMSSVNHAKATPTTKPVK